MKKLALYTAIIAATLTLLILLWLFRSVAILLILSLVLTAALRPIADFLEERGVRAPLARAIAYLLLVGIVGLGLFLIAGPLLKELQLLSNYLVIAYDQAYHIWASGSGFQQAVAARLPAPDQIDEMMTGSAGASILRLLFGVTQNFVTIVAGLVVVFALSLYWSADRSHFERLWLSLLPAGRRIQARRIWHTTEVTMGAYMRSEFLQSFLAVILLVVGYRIIGLDYPILTGLLAGVAWLIPLVGFLFAALISFLMGLASTGGLMPALIALALTAAVLAFLEFVVEPRLFHRSRFSGVLIVVVMVMLVDTYGLVGFIIAPPLAVALQVLGSHIIGAIRQSPTVTVEITSLEERLNALSALYGDGSAANGDGVSMPPEVASLHGRLTSLVDQAQRMIPEDL